MEGGGVGLPLLGCNLNLSRIILVVKVGKPADDIRHATCPLTVLLPCKRCISVAKTNEEHG